MISLALHQISWALVAAGAAIYFFVGMFWYAPSLFGKRWMQLTHRKPTDPILHAVLSEVVSSFIVSYGIAWFMEQMDAFTYADAVTTVIAGLITFAVPYLISQMMWERRSLQLVLINMGAFVISACAIAKLFVYMS